MRQRWQNSIGPVLENLTDEYPSMYLEDFIDAAERATKAPDQDGGTQPPSDDARTKEGSTDGQLGAGRPTRRGNRTGSQPATSDGAAGI